MKKILPVGILVVIILVGLFIYFKVMQPAKIENCIETTGLIEATEVGLSSKLPGRIDWLCCKEGDAIKADTPAIRLDNKELKARVQQGREALRGALSSLNVSETNLENAKLGTDAARADVQAAEAEVSRMNALTDDAKKNLQRVAGLFKDGLISEREMDSAKVNYDANYAQLNSALARKRSADAKFKTSLSNIKAAEAQRSAAKANAGESRAGLNVLETQFKDTEIISPIDGVVVYKAFEIGENIAAGIPVYTIHDLKNIWARVDVEETMIGNIKLGNKAKIVSAAISNKEFDGEVIEIGREGEFATQRDVTRGRSDIRTFRVKAGVKEPNGLLKSGMTVRVKIYCR